jgi:hypothetical protein
VQSLAQEDLNTPLHTLEFSTPPWIHLEKFTHPAGCIQPYIVLPSSNSEAALSSHIICGVWRSKINYKFPSVVMKCSLLSGDMPRGWTSWASPASRNLVEENNSVSLSQLCPADPIASPQGAETAAYQSYYLGKQLAGCCSGQEAGPCENVCAAGGGGVLSFYTS